MNMSEILKFSNVCRDIYTLKNARDFAQIIVGMNPRQDLDDAIMEAAQEQMDKLEEGRIQVFIPAGDQVTSLMVEDCLVDANSHKFEKGLRVHDPGTYGRRNEAYNGTRIIGGHHSSFFVYDSAAAVISDFINREGKSKLSLAVKENYLISLEQQLGFSVRWVERPLCD